MANRFLLLWCSKKYKCFLFSVQPCITLIMVVCTFVMLYHIPSYSSLANQKHLEMCPNISFSLGAINHSYHNERLRSKANQTLAIEAPDHASKNTFSSQSDNKGHKTQLHEESSYGKQTNNTSVQNNIKQQKAICQKVDNLTNIMDIGINTTHICGMLMETVNVNYSRNIYFTVKTTHKYYTDRLLLLMLTWLQAVDKNKVC